MHNKSGSTCFVKLKGNFQESLLFASVKGKNTVVSNFVNRLGVVVVIGVNAFSFLVSSL